MAAAHPNRRPRDDRDGAWKEILGRRFRQAVAFLFLDLVMPLPLDLAGEYITEVEKAEEEQAMPRIGQFEQMVEARGAVQAMREAVLEALQLRFPDKAAAADERLQQISDLGALKELLRKAITAASPAEFEGSLQ